MEALLLLRGMVSPVAARTALGSAERLAQVLAEAGTELALPTRPGLAMFGLPGMSAHIH